MKTSRKLLAILLAVLLLGAFALPISAETIEPEEQFCVHCWLGQPVEAEIPPDAVEAIFGGLSEVKLNEVLHIPDSPSSPIPISGDYMVTKLPKLPAAVSLENLTFQEIAEYLIGFEITECTVIGSDPPLPNGKTYSLADVLLATIGNITHSPEPLTFDGTPEDLAQKFIGEISPMEFVDCAECDVCKAGECSCCEHLTIFERIGTFLANLFRLINYLNTGKTDFYPILNQTK